MNQHIDPTLSEHLAELAELAGEIGASDTLIIRSPIIARLLLDFGRGHGDPHALDLAHYRNPAGVLVIHRFPASDGGEAGIEVKNSNPTNGRTTNNDLG